MATPVLEPCAEGVVRATGPAQPCNRRAGRWILAATIIASAMAFIDGTVVNVALPQLQAELHVDVGDVQWVIEAYSLFLSALLLIGGSLGDHYGRRRIFLIGVAIFAVASAGCGLAGNIMHLVVARAAQGIGAALLVPGSLAIISSSFAEADRGRAIGTWSGFSAMTTAIGPVLGGWMVEHISWRAVFFINLPLALAVMAISLRHVPESSATEKAPLDWLGAILIGGALGTLVYGLIESTRHGFSQPSVELSLILAAVLFVGFVVWEWRSADPMVPGELFHSGTFTGANLLTFFLYAALGGIFFFLPLNLIQVQHYSATAAGAALLPFILIMFLLSRWSGGLVSRFGARVPLVIGPIIAGIGYVLFLRPSLGGSYWRTFFPALMMLGTGMAVTVAPLTTAVMNAVPAGRVGIASGINNAVARTAGLVAIAALGVVMLHRFTTELQQGLSMTGLPNQIRQIALEQQTKLGGIEIPETLEARSRDQLRIAIEHAFIGAFRVVAEINAALAMLSALAAYFLIAPRQKAR